jgi:DnaK suppressor protein
MVSLLPSSDKPALQSDLARAQADLDRLSAEYDELLADPGVNQEDRDATRTLVEVARGHVQDIEQAIVRIESGTYGRCVKCGAAIPAERLEALPDADTCVSCG